jgi:transcriptional regulator with XRE-family HTH domain
MDAVVQRIKELRNKLELTQTDLAKKVGMTYVQIGRYEKRGAVPSSDVLKRLADALNTTTDYLMNGATDKVASEQLQDKELLNLFKAVESLGNEDKSMIKLFLDSLVTKRQIQQITR